MLTTVSTKDGEKLPEERQLRDCDSSLDLCGELMSLRLREEFSRGCGLLHRAVGRQEG